jgi:hypothetical protein
VIRAYSDAYLSDKVFCMLALTLSGPGIHTLEVGCGNNSPVTTKRWFPGSHYSGADIQRYNLNDQDLAAMDTFYLLILTARIFRDTRHSRFDLIVLHMLGSICQIRRRFWQRSALKRSALN